MEKKVSAEKAGESSGASVSDTASYRAVSPSPPTGCCHRGMSPLSRTLFRERLSRLWCVATRWPRAESLIDELRVRFLFNTYVIIFNTKNSIDML